MISIGAPTPIRFEQTNWRLRHPQIPTTPATAPRPQWGLNPKHTLFFDVIGQPLNRNLVSITYDFNTAREKADPNSGGGLDVHYQVPLVGNEDVFIESKGGKYSKHTYSIQKWHQNKYTWRNGNFVKSWTFDTDWFAPGSSDDVWEPVYHAVLANGFLYDPGQGGAIFKINKTDGSVVKRINPFGTTLDLNTYTASPLSTDGHGNILYNVVQISTPPTKSFYTNDVVNSWLVKVSSEASIKGEQVPRGTDKCKVSFANSDLPWPPTLNATPPTTPCGTQRPALNIAPAIAPNGTIYMVRTLRYPLLPDCGQPRSHR